MRAGTAAAERQRTGLADVVAHEYGAAERGQDEQGRDREQRWEPGGEDFFSPALMEADLMRRVMNKAEFARWFHRFLPEVARNRPPQLLQPAIVTANQNSGGGGAGAAVGGLLGHFGGWGSTVGAVAGGINVKKGEATVTLDLFNARTTEEMAMTQGYARKKDVSWGAGGGAAWWGGFAAAGGGGYQNTEIGQVIVLAYLDAYIQLVTQLGGLPANVSAAAPQAQ